MKNVAATSGHKVRRTDFFLGDTAKGRGSGWVCAVAVANFYGFLPRATHSHHPVSLVAGLAVQAIPRIRRSWFAVREYGKFAALWKKLEILGRFFFEPR
jgi:hypothetical protein